MKIVKGNVNDLDSLINLYSSVVRHLQENAIYQWDNQYPNSFIIEDDLRKGFLYGIKCESSYLGAIVLNEEQDLEYQQINWEMKKGKILCIHRLVIHPESQGNGLGKRLLNYAEEFAHQNGYTSIRLDAYSGNPIALNLYERHGYKKRGKVYFPRRDLPFICFEKLLSTEILD